MFGLTSVCRLGCLTIANGNLRALKKYYNTSLILKLKMNKKLIFQQKNVSYNLTVNFWAFSNHFSCVLLRLQTTVPKKIVLEMMASDLYVRFTQYSSLEYLKQFIKNGCKKIPQSMPSNRKYHSGFEGKTAAIMCQYFSE